MSATVEFRPDFQDDYPFICDECRGEFVLRGYTQECELDSDEFDAVCYANGIDPENAPYSFCESCHLKVN